MKMLMNVVERVAYAMHVISGLLLITMMVTVLLDVVSRTLFGASGGSIDFTFHGAVEIVSYGLLFMVLFALPYSVSSSQVIVDLFTERMGENAKQMLAGIFTLGFGLMGLGMAVKFYEATLRVAETGETTQDLLIPLSYLYAVTAAATAMLALRGLLVAIEQLQRRGNAS
ncbi:MAG: TRAP transporter small permease [Gammaproteobacteria bacterium]|nr:TRAP transporter small permease [Gammaproteobacteria bacterium]